MFATLLATKFFIPQARPHLVSRPRLIHRLNPGFAHKLTLVSAPPGFGKTSLLCEWVKTMEGDGETPRETGPRVAWLSLDESDNDPVRFWAYFITALKQSAGANSAFGEGALGMLQTPQPPPFEAVLTALINDLASIRDKIFLVLDDYHLIESQALHAALAFLLDHLPPHLQLVIATRIDPPLPLARLRAQNQLTEIRAADLRFTTIEAENFLNQVMNLDLSSEDIHALETRTEGWVTGLQLAALSMQGTQDATEFIKSFTGSHRFVLDYLIEEVLEQQPESVQTFLLRTAILDRFTGPLCDRLTGQEGGQATLERLDHANLFLVPLDDERGWFRYHHLFGDLIRARLQQSKPDTIAILHRRASKWFAENGLHDEAIDHALLAEDYPGAAALIEGIAQGIFIRGEDTKLGRWLEALPVEMVDSRPHLCVYRAWHLLANGKPAEANRVLQNCREDLTTSAGKSLEPELQGRLAATQAFTAFYHGDGPGIIEHASLALDLLPEKETAWRSIATHILGDAFGFTGEFKKGYQTRIDAVEVSKGTGNNYQLLIANLKLALNLRHQGKLPQVVEICKQQQELIKQWGMDQTVVAGFLCGIWGEALAETGKLGEALRLGEKGVTLASRGGDLAMLGWGYICLIRILFSSQDLERAQEMITQLEDIARRSFVPPWIMAYAAAWQARIWLVGDNAEAAAQWVTAQDLDPAGELDFQDEQANIMLARVLIAQGQLEAATDLLDRLYPLAEENGRISRAIEMLNLLAIATRESGAQDQAIKWLGQAFTLANPGGYVQIFVDEGPSMAGLLNEALAHGTAPDYIRRLLGAYPVTEPKWPEPSKSDSTELFEPLSDREIEVLELIGEGLSNKDIASRLYLSLNTVKGHTRNIYGKLGVHNRTQAFTRARALGILQSD